MTTPQEFTCQLFDRLKVGKVKGDVPDSEKGGEFVKSNTLTASSSSLNASAVRSLSNHSKEPHLNVLPVRPLAKPLSSTNGENKMSAQSIGLTVAAILSAAVTFYALSHDTSPNKAAVQMEYQKNENKAMDVKLAKIDLEKTALIVKSGAVVNLPQGLGSTSSTPVTDIPKQGRKIFVNGAVRMNGSENEVAAILILGGYPKEMVGDFKVVYELDESKVAWSSGWSTMPSPVNFESFMREAVSVEGNVKQLKIFSKGDTVLRM